MARVPITVLGYRCDQCDFEWLPRGNPSRTPRVCPSCKSRHWDQPRSITPPTYDEFREVVRATLHANTPMTWTEIRTIAKLPQKFPNNVWVHRMEHDIGLIRERDRHGIIQWRLSAQTPTNGK